MELKLQGLSLARIPLIYKAYEYICNVVIYKLYNTQYLSIWNVIPNNLDLSTIIAVFKGIWITPLYVISLLN